MRNVDCHPRASGDPVHADVASQSASNVKPYLRQRGFRDPIREGYWVTAGAGMTGGVCDNARGS